MSGTARLHPAGADGACRLQFCFVIRAGIDAVPRFVALIAEGEGFAGVDRPSPRFDQMHSHLLGRPAQPLRGQRTRQRGPHHGGHRRDESQHEQ
ncbi:MAG: hypothetical protein B7Z73_14610 [Planctomycetia bacterium 21-64-5]|nr:MAG: hypothetical protein B7Z73_14610 [Planctomycetia bacterium 21-64-5]